MSCVKSEAENQFWETPELVDMLLTFLDLQSTLHLAQNHEVTWKILQGSFAWNKLIRRTCVSGDQNMFYYSTESLEMKHKVDAMRLLVAILKLMRDPKAKMLDLLNTICQRCPIIPSWARCFTTVTIGRSTRDHEVVLADFLLLEENEGAFGTTEQDVKAICNNK